MKALFLTGPHAVGKSYGVKKLQENGRLENTLIIDTGPLIRSLHKKMAPNQSFGSWIQEIEAQYGPNITNYLLVQEITAMVQQSNVDNLIVIGYRTFEGIGYFLDMMKISDYKVLYIDSSIDTLYVNYLAREKYISKEDFIAYIAQEQASGLGNLRQMALNNTDNFEYFFKENNYVSFDPIVLKFFSGERQYNRG